MQEVLLQNDQAKKQNVPQERHGITTSHRKPGLDALRAIAIVLVVWYHSFELLRPLFSLPIIGGLLKKTFVLSTWIGPLGVDLFFVLSGFLIGSILIRQYLKEDKFSINNVVHFWMRRWLRTVPNYYITLGICFLLYGYLYDTKFDFRYFLFVQNFAYAHPKFFGEAWSLAVEEWFYLTVPVSLVLVGTLSEKLSKDKVLLITFISYLLFFLTLRILKCLTSENLDLDLDIRKVVIFRLDAIMYGVVVAFAYLKRRDLLFRNRNTFALIGILGAAMSIGLVFFLTEKTNFYIQNQLIKFLINSSYYIAIPLFFSMLLPYAIFHRGIKNRLLNKGVMRISLISYSLYLIHYSLIYIPFFENVAFESPVVTLLTYVFYWAVVLGLSNLNYSLIEVPIMRLRDRFNPEKYH